MTFDKLCDKKMVAGTQLALHTILVYTCHSVLEHLKIKREEIENAAAAKKANVPIKKDSKYGKPPPPFNRTG